MDDHSPRFNSNFEGDDMTSPFQNYGSPYQEFPIPKSKVRSPDSDLDNFGFNGHHPEISKFDEPQQEYQVRFDVYGKSIVEQMSSPFTYTSGSTKDDSSRNNSSHKQSKQYSLDNEGDDEELEWNLDKENLNPSLLTPLKSRGSHDPHLHPGSIPRNNLRRSPLQDITPPLGKKKVNSGKFEGSLLYSGGTPKIDNQGTPNEGNKTISCLRSFR